MEQRRILGVDYGTKRIGLALSDPLRILASAFTTLENSSTLWDQLKDIIKTHDVEFVVIGSPLNLKGEKAAAAMEVEEFVREFKSRVPVDVVLWDERFTTTLAHQYRLASGMPRQKRRKSQARIDAAAAAILLQGFLDSTKQSMSC